MLSRLVDMASLATKNQISLVPYLTSSDLPQ